MKARNEPIGDVVCPTKGCDQVAKVFRFRPRGTPDRKTVFSGKLYCECPAHGRIGADGNATINEYLLEHAKIWQPTSGGTASADASKKNPPTAARTTEPASTKASTSAASGSRWRPLIDLE